MSDSLSLVFFDHPHQSFEHAYAHAIWDHMLNEHNWMLLQSDIKMHVEKYQILGMDFGPLPYFTLKMAPNLKWCS